MESRASGSEGEKAVSAARREDGAARPVPASVQRQRDTALNVAITRMMRDLADEPEVVVHPARSRNEVVG